MAVEQAKKELAESFAALILPLEKELNELKEQAQKQEDSADRNYHDLDQKLETLQGKINDLEGRMERETTETKEMIRSGEKKQTTYLLISALFIAALIVLFRFL